MRTKARLIRDIQGTLAPDVDAAITCVLFDGREIARRILAKSSHEKVLRCEIADEDGKTIAIVPLDGSAGPTS